MGQWSALPIDLLKAIEERLILYPDKVRLRSVCASWHSALPKMPNHRVRQLPWLLLPHGPSGETSWAFFNPIEKRVYIIDLPEARGKLIRGSSHGWVVTVGRSPAIYVVNPLTRVQVQLPPRSRFPDVVKYRADKPGNEYALRPLDRNIRGLKTSSATEVAYFTHKIVLSSLPTSKDWVAVAIYGVYQRLAYCRYGDKKWAPLDNGRIFGSDVIFHKGQFYVVNGGIVMVFDIGSCIKMAKILPRVGTVSSWLYLVESGGELMVVERFVGCDGLFELDEKHTYKTHGFKIFRLDTSSSTWCPVKNLGDDLLFLGWNSSLAISAREFTGYTGNRIYFTDDTVDFQEEGVRGGHDVGVFNVDDESFEPLPGYKCESLLVWPPPIWVMPNPYN